MKKYENPMIKIAVFDKENVVTDSAIGILANTALGDAVNHYNGDMKSYGYILDFNKIF